MVEGEEALRSPHLDWLRLEVARLAAGIGSPAASPQPTSTPDDAWTTLWNSFTGSPAGASFDQAVDAMGSDVEALLNPDDAATLEACPLTGPIGALDRNRALLVLADTLRQDLLALVESMATTLTQWLDTPLEPGPEADLYRWVAAAAGQSSPPPPTQADLAILQVAYPLTLWFTSRTGVGPFPHGTFPPLTASAGGPPPPGGLPAIPSLWGIVNLIRASLAQDSIPGDVLVNSLPPLGQAFFEDQMRTFAIYRLADGALSALSLYGSSWGDNNVDDTRWALAGVEILTALIETYMAFSLGSSLNYLNLNNGAHGVKFLSFLGLTRVWLSCLLWTVSPKSDYSWNESLSGVIRALPDATAFTRAWLVAADPLARALYPLKMALDIWAHKWQEDNANYLATVERQTPLTVEEVRDQKARFGQPFSLQLDCTGGWPPYTWNVQGLPDGLSASAEGLITGMPVKVQKRTVTCRVRDACPPLVYAQMTFKIIVT